MTRVLVTGATGFVGKHLINSLKKEGFEVRAAVRQHQDDFPVPQVCVGQINGKTDWREALEGCQMVVHLAARVHVMQEHSADPLTLYRTVNTEGTRALAEQAQEANVQRFIYLSTIKVLGEQTQRPFDENTLPHPTCPYSQSKSEAEQLLRKTALPYVIIRPPLVYGPGVGGNVQRLLSLIARYRCLPLGGIQNRRSLVSVENLVSLIVHCLRHEQAIRQTFLVSDNQDLSTTKLARLMAKAMGKHCFLLPFSQWCLKVAGRVLHKQAEVSRLIGSLQVDMGYTQQRLSWHPPVSPDEALQKMVRWYQGSEI